MLEAVLNGDYVTDSGPAPRLSPHWPLGNPVGLHRYGPSLFLSFLIVNVRVEITPQRVAMAVNYISRVKRTEQRPAQGGVLGMLVLRLRGWT